MSKTTLELEMEICKLRNVSPFGLKLKEICDYTKDSFSSEEDEYGLTYTPLFALRSIYSVDGDELHVYKRLIRILENYDLGYFDNGSFNSEDKKLEILIGELKVLAL